MKAQPKTDIKKPKRRFLSPSYRKGAVNELKSLRDKITEFNLDIFDCEDDYKEEEEAKPKKLPLQKQLTMQEEISQEIEKKLSEEVNYEQPTNPDTTEPTQEGRVKTIAFNSQAGKGEDGQPKVNQDSYLVIQNEYNLTDFKIFSVLDGHGEHGHYVSRFVTKYFTAFLKRNKKMNSLKSEDEVYQRLRKNNYDILKKAFKYAERDISKSNINAELSGTTCVMVFQIGNKIICANVGDSRAIMVKKNNVIVPLSIDQKPNNPYEKKRIEASGGEVRQYVDEEGEASGPHRVWKKGQMFPGIAMSRSVGDLIASSLGVICEPVFLEESIDKDCMFIVIASDGVWEFLNNKNVCDIVMSYYKKGDPDGACNALIKESTKLWNKEDEVVDDITAIVVFF